MAIMIAPQTNSQSVLTDSDLFAYVNDHSTPCYIYDLTVLSRRIAELESALAPSRSALYFATMANDRPRVLSALAQKGLGACVNSLPHLSLALSSGFLAERIQFTSTGVSLTDMRALTHAGVQTNLDSLSQLSSWFEFGNRSAGLRLNAFSLAQVGKQDRIGVPPAAIREALSIAHSKGAVIAGLHVYVGTNFQSPEHMAPTLREFFRVAGETPDLEYINIGGGIGVNYLGDGPAFDLQLFGSMLAEFAEMMRSRAGRDIRIICEPGRGLVASCGVFLTRVTDVKVLSNERFVAVDGSVAVFPRPLHHPDTPHAARRLEKNGASMTLSPATLVGRTTFSKDILGRSPLPDDTVVGDIIVLDNAGAYSQSMASRFLGQPEPDVLFVENDFP